MLFSSTISCSAILWQREKKGNGTFAPPSAEMNDSRPNSALAQTISRDPHEKRRRLLPAGDVSLSPHAPAIRTFRRARQYVREDLVKVPEVRKRSACYHR